LYLAILFLAFRNLRKIRSLAAYRENPEIRVFSGALWASLLAFAVGSFFASFEYELFPYFMVAYTSVLYRWCVQISEGRITPAAALPTRPTVHRLHERKESWKR
jgi:hypothetical protein